MTGPQIPNLFKVPELEETLLFTFLCLVISRIWGDIEPPGMTLHAVFEGFV